MQAEPGGSVALVKFHHALSSIRAVVNINGFSSSSTAADNRTNVSNMRLLHQPTMYIWEQDKWGVEPFRAQSTYADAEQAKVDEAWKNTTHAVNLSPRYNQRKDIKLWIPQPPTTNDQSKTFVFYGITTPQPSTYLTTLPENDTNRKLELQFDVTYPDPMQPSKNVTRTYTASLADVYFEAGYNTTINISLNHRNEQMTVGAEYENWQFVATPDVGQLKKNSTFLQDTQRSNVTIIGDEKATIDDATWLYSMTDNNNVTTIYDIYGHTGTKTDPYQISTAYQLLSFAYEVKAGRNFEGKYIRLDADITLQPTSDKTKAEFDELAEGESNPLYEDAPNAIDWIGIGDETHTFNGTFLGGKRFIYRLKGTPLFYSLGAKARIEQLQVNTVHKPNGSTPAVTGGGMYANTNAGLICGCKVVGDVAFDGSTVGAFVGTNTGILWASYHVGATISTATSAATIGGLVGSNSGVVASCYHAGKISGKSGSAIGGIVASNSGTLDNNYYNSMLATPTVSFSGVTPKTTSEMTKQAFVYGEGGKEDDLKEGGLNYGINAWRTDPNSDHSGYEAHYYVYQPANYPKLNETTE